jgi:hypothetical protein
MFQVFKNLPKFFELLKEGKEVADPQTWKQRAVAINAVVAIIGTILALAKAYGADLALDDQTVSDLGAGVVAFVAAINGIVHVATDKKLGLQSNS